ncbi:MAG TPA: hypothetical protein VKG79_11140 [Bryobacteraceae bacterium]|nr:hypothetical protein [Bryobacteraceae bacterium]
MRAQHVEGLVRDLHGEFYIDAEAAKDALRRGRPFNLIHFETSYKFDMFPLPDDPYHRLQLARSKAESISLAEGISVQSFVATAEDTILSKLVWYRLGGEQSEQQWNDLRGVLAVKGADLDRSYLLEWAPRLRVSDLLDKLLSVENTH